MAKQSKEFENNKGRFKDPEAASAAGKKRWENYKNADEWKRAMLEEAGKPYPPPTRIDILMDVVFKQSTGFASAYNGLMKYLGHGEEVTEEFSGGRCPTCNRDEHLVERWLELTGMTELQFADWVLDYTKDKIHKPRKEPKPPVSGMLPKRKEPKPVEPEPEPVEYQDYIERWPDGTEKMPTLTAEEHFKKAIRDSEKPDPPLNPYK